MTPAAAASGGSGTIIRGTTDQPVSLRPGGRVRPALLRRHLQRLPEPAPDPARRDKPVPEAAESCDFTDDDDLRVHAARTALKFSDGSHADAEDVKFSFERNVEIADPNGASSLLANMKSIEAPTTRHGRLQPRRRPTRPGPRCWRPRSFAIVPSDIFPADKLQADDKVVGSGRYTVAQYEPGQQTVLAGERRVHRRGPGEERPAIIQYFDKASALKLAVEQGDVDIAYRSLSPTDLEDLRERRRRQRRRRARARRSATSSSTSTCSRATTTRRSWRSARPSRRRSTASRSPTTSTTAPSSRCTR